MVISRQSLCNPAQHLCFYGCCVVNYDCFKISASHISTTDYRRLGNKVFFHQNPTLLNLGRQFSFGTFGVFLGDLSAPILVLRVPCPCFLLINHYFYKKLSLYIQIPIVYLRLGFQFGLQRIRDLAIMCL